MALSSLNLNFIYSSYTADRDNLFRAEENQAAKPGIVDDGKQIPTIGIGFNLSALPWSVTSALLSYALGEGHSAELSILQAWRLQTSVDPATYSFIDFNDGKHPNNTLNKFDILLMAGVKVAGQQLPASQQLLAGLTLSPLQQTTLLDAMLDGPPTPIPGYTPYETALTTKLANLGAGTVAPSEERVSLISLAYNSTNLSLIGPGLASAIAGGQRGTAWYQIAYANSDIGLKSLELRHQFEADNFGLLATPDESNTAIGAVLSQIYGDSTVYDAINAKIGSMYSLAGYKDTLPDAVQKWLSPFNSAASVDFVNYGTVAGPLTPSDARNILTFSANGHGVVTAPQGGELIGQADATTLTGGPGPDTIIANRSGPVSLNGGAGNDTLIANSGADTLTGGTGRDVLVAGAGPDVFVYADPTDSERGSTTGTYLTLSDAYAARDGSAATGTEWFLVSLSKPASAGNPVSFTWQTTELPTTSALFNPAVAGLDYAAVGPTTVTFAAGQNYMWLPVTLRTPKKSNYDFTRDFGVTVSNLSGAAAAVSGDTTAIGHILDDHGYRLFPVLQVPDAVAPEGGAAKVLLSLSSQPLTNVTISYTLRDGTAVAGVDYTPPAVTPITLLGSTTSAALTISTPVDPTTDGDKYFFIDWTITGGAARFAGGATTQTSEVEIKANDGHRQDIIYGFKLGQDRIDVSGIDANLTQPGMQQFRFIGTANFTGPGQVRYAAFGADTLVQANVDGSNLPNLQIELAGIYKLTPANFIFSAPATAASAQSPPEAADTVDIAAFAHSDATDRAVLPDTGTVPPSAVDDLVTQAPAADALQTDALQTSTLQPDQTVSGAITTPGGEDDYQVTMQAGQIYDIVASATDGTPGEAYLTVYDAAGTILSYANAGLDIAAELFFSPTITGTYVVGASMQDWDYTGAYNLSLDAAQAAPGQGVFGFADTYEVAQPTPNGAALTFQIQRSGDLTGTATVDYQASADAVGQNADASDFQGGAFPSGTLTFAAGQTSQSVVINAATTGAADPHDFELDLLNASGASLINTPSATGEIAVAVACYLAGTLISTSSGERPVEQLAPGDEVTTASGSRERILWVGRRSYAGRFLSGRDHLHPVLIRAGALGGGLPRRDLLVSPGHAMFLNGFLVPARCLVNGTTIAQEHGLKQIDYYHVELKTHDIILAEGAPSESFVDDDSRRMFHNAAEWDWLYPGCKRPPAVFCAPRVESGPELEVIRRRLADVVRRIGHAMKLGAGTTGVHLPEANCSGRVKASSGDGGRPEPLRLEPLLLGPDAAEIGVGMGGIRPRRRRGRKRVGITVDPHIPEFPHGNSVDRLRSQAVRQVEFV